MLKSMSKLSMQQEEKAVQRRLAFCVSHVLVASLPPPDLSDPRLAQTGPPSPVPHTYVEAPTAGLTRPGDYF